MLVRHEGARCQRVQVPPATLPLIFYVYDPPRFLLAFSRSFLRIRREQIQEWFGKALDIRRLIDENATLINSPPLA